MSQYALNLNLPAVFSADNFFVSDCNRVAWRWIEAWPDWPTHALLLCGPEGSGKSHLGHIWAQRAGAAILPAGSLNAQASAAMRGNCLIEDIENASDARALLHAFNASRENGGSLLLTSLLPVRQLPFALPDLVSRLLASTQAAIAAPDDAVLAAAMRKQFADRQMKVDEEVIAYIVPRMERSLSNVKALVGRIDTAAMAERKNLTIPFVKGLITVKTEE